METLLSRSVKESDSGARIFLAESIGEVGALDVHILDDNVTIERKRPETTLENLQSWRANNPPWRSRRARYELQLVTNHLVHGLKAAPTSGDQHKIAFCMQQLLVLLDHSARGAATTTPMDGGEMSDWLKSQLSQAGVLDIVEPFWFSDFHEMEGSNPSKQPPFFRKATTYFSWMSNWCRYMINRAHESKTQWSGLFHACRTAVRTTAGLGATEFLLPILVLDRLCFGNAQDERVMIGEMRDALSFTSASADEDRTERQKVVNAIFTVIETLQLWSEEEIEKRHHTSRRKVTDPPAKSRTQDSNVTGDTWPLDESLMRIEDLLQGIPLSIRAHAAAKIGMNARALRLLELASRESVAGCVFNGTEQSGANHDWKRNRSRAAGTCPRTQSELFKEVLVELQDYETLSAVDQELSDPISSAKDSIRRKVSCGDWEGALQDYERALQLISPVDLQLQSGALRCLLELDQYDSVLNQVYGILRQTSLAKGTSAIVPLGVEAAWRLGRWEKLAELVDTGNHSLVDTESQYQHSVGKLMLGMHQKNHHLVLTSLRDARKAVMVQLSSTARESYSSSYEHIVKLQSLREAEDVAHLLCTEPRSDLGDVSIGLGWQRRLDFVAPSGFKHVVKSRLALSRLAKDERSEGSLFLDLGRVARKSGFHNIAANCFAHAEATFLSPGGDQNNCHMLSLLQLQIAKLKKECGDGSAALKILPLDDLECYSDVDKDRLLAEVSRFVSIGRGNTSSDAVADSEAIDTFVRSALQSTLWMIEGGLKSHAEVSNRFRVIHRLVPDWEKGEIKGVSGIVVIDPVSQKCVIARALPIRKVYRWSVRHTTQSPREQATTS